MFLSTSGRLRVNSCSSQFVLKSHFGQSVGPTHNFGQSVLICSISTRVVVNSYTFWLMRTDQNEYEPTK